MTFRGVGFDGHFRLFAGEAVKSQIEREANIRYRDSSLRAEVVTRLLTHQYVSLDRARMAAERAQKERARRCRLQAEPLRKGLAAGRVTQLGLEGRKGKPGLTAEMLSKGHAVQYLDIDEDRLLLCVERHPMGGRQSWYLQYWLYDAAAKTVRLLPEGDWMQEPILTGSIMVGTGGTSRPADTALEDDFLRQIESDLGPAFKQKFMKMLQPQESSLLSINVLPNAVVVEIQTLTGLDIIQREEEVVARVEAQNDKKYGSSNANVPAGVYMVPGSIRLGIVPSGSDRGTD